ncbi:MAG TPA: hypothetical protein VMZ28_23500 [Kofleriaceae bacterium]|nr:hypothetical protein [Kofleriaceae bacterium]
MTTARSLRSLPLLLAAVLPLALCVAPGRAAADDGQVLVIEFSGEGEVGDAPARFTQEMADVLRESGAEVTVAPREDALSLAGCTDTSDECLRQALGVLGVQRVVVGAVRSDGDGSYEVGVRIIAAEEEPRARAITVRGKTPDEAAPAFKTQSGAFWRGEEPPAAEPEPEPIPEAATTTEPEPEPEPERGRAPFSAGKVEPWAWAVAGGGVGLMAVGGVFLLAAKGKQSDVDDAPTDTVDDLETLEDLESSGKRYARFGSAFVLVGAVAAIVGGVFVYRQGTRPDEVEEPAVTLAPMLAPGGAGLTLTVRTP